MKLIMALIFLTVSTLAMAADQTECDKLTAENATPEQLAQRGCCSWHDGVCGCSSGTVKCCDGSLSPSCECHGDDIKELKKNETEIPNS